MIRTHQLIHSNGAWHVQPSAHEAAANACQLVLVFGARHALERTEVVAELRSTFKEARIVYASTAGEIAGSKVLDDSIVATGLSFERSTVRCATTNIRDHANSSDCGAWLLRSLPEQGLSAALVFSDGGLVNGSELAEGLNRENPARIPITGGLAGDGDQFQHTLCGLDEVLAEGQVVLVGLYGVGLNVGHGSYGGWGEFGPERMVTYSESNVLFKIDGRSALSLYKEYLGPYSKELPGSALLFPLSMRVDGSPNKLVRTILSVNEENDSMTFAGNMPYGAHVRLMKATFDKLVDAASTAARDSFSSFGTVKPQFALLISCVGRKLVLQDRVEEEVEAAQAMFGTDTCIAGLYSYGELSPFKPKAACDLHNQTMTITTLSEA